MRGLTKALLVAGVGAETRLVAVADAAVAVGAAALEADFVSDDLGKPREFVRTLLHGKSPNFDEQSDTPLW